MKIYEKEDEQGKSECYPCGHKVFFLGGGGGSSPLTHRSAMKEEVKKERARRGRRSGRGRRTAE
jgi:hypothetical protein